MLEQQFIQIQSYYELPMNNLTAMTARSYRDMQPGHLIYPLKITGLVYYFLPFLSYILVTNGSSANDKRVNQSVYYAVAVHKVFAYYLDIDPFFTVRTSDSSVIT